MRKIRLDGDHRCVIPGHLSAAGGRPRPDPGPLCYNEPESKRRKTPPMDERCVFCTTDGGERVYADAHCRVVLTNEPFTGFCRVVAARHVREMTDLPLPEREHVLRVVFALEMALREMLHPDKMNVASLGNMVPHVHWHVIPRFADDSHFPKPVWADSVREPAQRTLPADFVSRLSARLARQLDSDRA